MDSGHALTSDNNNGLHKGAPMETIDAAIAKCTASSGDVIVVAPGHTETLTNTTRITVDVAGVSIIGQGNGDNRPVLTFGTDTTADLLVSADNVLIKNIKFVSNINDLGMFIDSNAENLTVEDCLFLTSSGKEAHCFIDQATTKDYLTVRNCTFIQPSDPEGTDGGAATGAICLVDSQYVLIDGCHFQGEFESAIIHNLTTAATDLWITNCFGHQALDGAVPLVLVATGTGGMRRCDWLVSDAADATTETEFCVIGAASPFGFFDTYFMNDNAAGGNLALAVTAAMA